MATPYKKEEKTSVMYNHTQINVFINSVDKQKLDYYKAIHDTFYHASVANRESGKYSSHTISKSSSMGLDTIMDLKVWIIQDKYKNRSYCPDKEYDEIYLECEKVLIPFEIPYQITIHFVLPNTAENFYLRGCDDQETTTTFVGFTESEVNLLKQRLIFRPSCWQDSPEYDKTWSIPQSPANPASYYAEDYDNALKSKPNRCSIINLYLFYNKISSLNSERNRLIHLIKKCDYYKAVSSTFPKAKPASKILLNIETIIWNDDRSYYDESEEETYIQPHLEYILNAIKDTELLLHYRVNVVGNDTNYKFPIEEVNSQSFMHFIGFPKEGDALNKISKTFIILPPTKISEENHQIA